MNKIEDWFYNHKHTLKCYKWVHYFEIYERHFSRFLNKENVSILEIGVYDGGSLEMWDYFFDGKAKIVGLDINPDCLKLQQHFGDNVTIELGDQADVEYWNDFKERYGEFDIILDDGGHTMNQQIVSFDCMYDHVKEDGVYMVEDTHTSYFNNFGGDINGTDTFIAKTKHFIDWLHVHHFKHGEGTQKMVDFHAKTKSISYYNSVVAFEKGKQVLPESKRL